MNVSKKKIVFVHVLLGLATADHRYLDLAYLE